MNYSDFIYDFNLYLCERFGYRNCCSVMHNANGICVSVHVGEMDLYNPQNEMFRLLGTKRSFSQNETFFFSHPYPLYPALFRLISHF